MNTLAGTVVDADGRLLAFAFLAADTTDAVAAQAALDRMATALAACGCAGCAAPRRGTAPGRPAPAVHADRRGLPQAAALTYG